MGPRGTGLEFSAGFQLTNSIVIFDFIEYEGSMNRALIIKIHLILACVYLPFMLMMPFTGVSYLLGFKGEEVKTEIFRAPPPTSLQEVELKKYFQTSLEANGIKPNFESIKANGQEFILRPSTRVHYVVKNNPEGDWAFFKVEPNLLRRLIEIHKGHGPKLMKWFEISFGAALILTTMSGLWLAITIPTYRKITAISFALGLLVIVFSLV
ncbi:MAG: hypothetical protein ACK5V3_11130 [Bdellovibrionales bacterium]